MTRIHLFAHAGAVGLAVSACPSRVLHGRAPERAVARPPDEPRAERVLGTRAAPARERGASTPADPRAGP